MCGRFSLKTPVEEIRNRFKIKGGATEWREKYQISPTDITPVITQAQPDTINLYHWGMIPAWSKGPKALPIALNARVESLTVKPMFRNLMDTNRCLVLADGFFEWKSIPNFVGTLPHYIQLQSRALFAFAGIWDSWKDNQCNDFLSYCFVTLPAPQWFMPIHDRIPAILVGDSLQAWLSGSTIDAMSCIVPPEEMVCYPVELKKYESTNPLSIQPIELPPLQSSLF